MNCWTNKFFVPTSKIFIYTFLSFFIGVLCLSPIMSTTIITIITIDKY